MEFTNLIQTFSALFFVIALILACAFAVKHFGLGSGMRATKRENRRLNIRESLTIDPRHRLVLIERDDVEHLLLLSSTTCQIVESGIKRQT